GGEACAGWAKAARRLTATAALRKARVGLPSFCTRGPRAGAETDETRPRAGRRGTPQPLLNAAVREPLRRHEVPPPRPPDRPALHRRRQRAAVAARAPEAAVDSPAQLVPGELAAVSQGGDDRLDLLVDVLVRHARRRGLERGVGVRAARERLRLALALGLLRRQRCRHVLEVLLRRLDA